MNFINFAAISMLWASTNVNAFQAPTVTFQSPKWKTTSSLQESNTNSVPNRRNFLSTSAASVASAFLVLDNNPNSAFAAEDASSGGIQDSLDIENFLRSGVDSGGPMGVSSQTGKSRPQTGIFFRDGTDVSRDKRTGSVVAEIVLGTKAEPVPVMVSYNSPWALAKGSVYDIECRDAKTGDGAFVSVVLDTEETKGKSIADLSNNFFVTNLFSPTGRFSFYGSPTNIKVTSSNVVNDTRYLELSFSNLSQSTQTEIPRKALLAATIAKGTDNVVMLVGSAAAPRWKKSEVKDAITSTVESFKVTPSPKSNLKVRIKRRGDELIDF